MDAQRQFSIRLLKMIYWFLGIFFHPKNQKCLTTIFLSVLVFSAPLTLYFEIFAFIIVDDTIFRVEAVAFIVFTVLYSLTVIITQTMKARWIFFFESVQSLLINQSLNDHFEALLLKDKQYVIFFLCLFNFLFIFPVINICTTNVQLGSYKTLLLPIKYPWPADSPFSYTMTMIFQCWGVIILAFCTLGNVAVVYYFRALITSTSAALKKKVSRLNTGTSYLSWTKKNVSDNVYHDYDREHFQSIIRSHQDLMRLVNQYKELLAPYTYIAIINFFISGVFIVATTILVEDNFLHRMKLINILLTACCQLVFLCAVGQILDEMNTRVMRLLYNINWYEKSLSFRKDMITFMIFLQKQQSIKIFRIKVLNWVFIAAIIRVTYSALQVFVKMQG